MPQIIVTAGAGAGLERATVTLRERVNADDFESERFAANLLERLGWAVEDATAAEEQHPTAAEQHPAGARDMPKDQHSLQPEGDPEPVGIA